MTRKEKLLKYKRIMEGLSPVQLALLPMIYKHLLMITEECDMIDDWWDAADGVGYEAGIPIIKIQFIPSYLEICEKAMGMMGEDIHNAIVAWIETTDPTMYGSENYAHGDEVWVPFMRTKDFERRMANELATCADFVKLIESCSCDIEMFVTLSSISSAADGHNIDFE